MTRVIDRQKALNLRRQGKTYNEIKKELKIAKSTLSEWLSKFPLTEEQMHLLKKSRKGSRIIASEKNRITKQKKRDKRIEEAYEKEKKRWISLSKRELELAGIFLYWGEGAKLINGPIFLNNTDPKVLKFTLYWLIFALEIPKEKIKIVLHLYNDMDIKKELEFWSKELKLPLSQFSKPYIKKSTRVNIDHKGFGHGTCGLLVSNVLLKERIMMTIKAVSNYYSSKIEAMV